MNPIQLDDFTFLRPLAEADAADIFHAIDSQREYLGRWLPFVAFTLEPADTLTFVRSVVYAPESVREKVFTIRHQEQFAGIIGFKDTDRVNRRTELGYWLSEPFQHKGIISRSVKRLLLLAFKEMDMNRVQIRCAAGNTPSINVPRRLGFHYEGTERAGELLSSGDFADLEVYSLLRQEFHTLQQQNQ